MYQTSLDDVKLVVELSKPLDVVKLKVREYVGSKEEGIDLSELKPLLKKAIKNEFLKSFNKGFTCSNGITMDCNMYDIDLLRKGLDLAVKLGQTEMLVRDFYNKTHSLSIEEVEKMLIELGLNWQRLWQKKVSLQEKVDTIKSFEDLENLRWE